MKFRTQHEFYPRESAIVFPDDGRTKQSFKKESDINEIVKKAERVGGLPPVEKIPRYGDYSDVPSYQDALHRVMQAEEQFMALPSDVRKRFSNDPSEFLSFASNPQNANELVELGLAKSKPSPQPAAVSSSERNVEASPKPSKPSPKAKGDNGDDT